ncbi:MAG: hypothetical protein LBP69_08005, partial [Treponema sp.]|nr:hypothetical protein [Treponema sp.]
MKCDEFINLVYETDEKLSIRERLRLAFHVFLCGRCATELRRFEDARELLVSGFIPSSPDFTDAIMDKIYAEEQGEEVF